MLTTQLRKLMSAANRVRHARSSASRSAQAVLRAGELLTLKSGGRTMTATWAGPVLFAPGNWLICQWFTDAGELQQEMFPEETLVRAREAFAG